MLIVVYILFFPYTISYRGQTKYYCGLEVGLLVKMGLLVIYTHPIDFIYHAMMALTPTHVSLGLLGTTCATNNCN
jgi:hypothetical protein